MSLWPFRRKTKPKVDHEAERRRAQEKDEIANLRKEQTEQWRRVVQLEADILRGRRD